MLLNRKNYEYYVIDYLEGRLSEEDIQRFEEFLIKNPDLRSEIDEFREMVLLPEHIEFTHKQTLKKILPAEASNILNEKLDEDCIAYYEEDMDPVQKQAFEKELELHPDQERVFLEYKKVYMEPDTQIIFKGKQRLRKLTLKQRRIRIYSIVSSAAAVLLLFMILFNPWKSTQQITVRENENIPSEIHPDNLNELETTEAAEQIPVGEKQITDDLAAKTDDAIIIDKGNDFQETSINESGDGDQAGQNPIYESINLQKINALQASLEPDIPITDQIQLVSSPSQTGSNYDYLTVTEYANKSILRRILRIDPAGSERKLTFWDLADLGFNGMDNLFEGNYKLDRDIDEYGNVKKISFETPIFGYTASVKSNKDVQ